MAIDTYVLQEHSRLLEYLNARWQGYAEGRLNVVDWAIAVMEQHRHCHELIELGLCVRCETLPPAPGVYY